jgi:hypothetical protein
LAGARPESARADSGRAKIPEGVRFAAASLFMHIKAFRWRKIGNPLAPIPVIARRSLKAPHPLPLRYSTVVTGS